MSDKEKLIAVLVGAKALLPTRSHWTHYSASGVTWAPDGSTLNCWTPQGAIIRAALNTPDAVAFDAIRAFKTAAGIADDTMTGAWNRAPGRTYEDVMTAFDRAIEIAKETTS